MKFLREHLFAFIGTVLGVAILVLILSTSFNIFDTGLRELLHIENDELDELVTAFLLMIAGFVIDVFRARGFARRQSEIDEHRLQVLQATMRTVQDLVNNFLNNMQLFRMEAEEGEITPESLKVFDNLIFETAAKLKALGDLESVVEYKMAPGAGIHIPDTESAK